MERPRSTGRPWVLAAAALLHLLLLAPTLAAAFNYADALAKSIIFFEGQRSGKLPPGNRMAWRGDSGLKDGAQHNVDLVGGYYDAGDNVKFGLPMAFTTTMLAWSVADFGKFMGAELPHARAAVRWGADYLLKAATSTPDTLYVQVADPNQDHRCWERPEDMDTPRAVYAVTKDNPGSDVAAETAAALAASAVAFRRADPAYSSRLLHAAMRVFEFADRHRGSYSEGPLSAAVCPFYCSYSGYQDELLWAAAWLHRASNNASFMSYVRDNGMQLGAGDDDYSFSWDDKRIGTKVLLAKGFLRRNLPGLQLYKSHSDSYICSLVPGTTSFQPSQYTPGGLIYKEGASNMQYVTTATFLLVAYARYLRSAGACVMCGGRDVSPAELVALAKRQVDYVLGKNPAGTSYMVGFGARYPRRLHHRGASMPSVRAHPGRIGCDEGFRYLHSSEPDANVLVGAVVGGPDARDAFVDDRDGYGQTEPATYINAPLVGALAYFAGTAKY
ncbi:Endoglucanase 19 [Dichanthelium oligosanthes]|uniref:Endoglucanase n=1 Tax=Dichanthelium oligosanthes TaxID=888268 RepID=A0A1E5V5V3_9POAL|nr:Endoglucanase 19 [Dichanthelium oligosanthes]